MKRLIIGTVALSALFATQEAGAVLWKVGTPSNSSWADGANWSGGIVPDAAGNAEFAWDSAKDTIPSGTYYVRLDCSPVIAQLGQPSWRSVPPQTYIGIERDRILGRTITLCGFYRGSNTGADLYVDVPVILSGACLADIDQGYNAQNGFHFNRTISGSFGITKKGNGSLWLNGQNTYTGVTTVVAGSLYAGDGANCTASFASPIVNNANLTVDPGPNGVTVIPGLSGTGSFTKKGRGTLTFAGSQITGGSFLITRHSWTESHSGSLDCTVPGGATANFTTQTWKDHFTFLGTENLNLGTSPVLLELDQNNNPRVVTVVTNTLTVGGSISGSMGLSKAGRGTMVLTAANAFTGTASANGGVLRLSGSGSAGTGAVSVSGDGTLELDNSVANANRLGDAAAITVGGSVRLVGNGAEVTSETAGALTLATGRAVFEVLPAEGQTASLVFASLAARTAGNSTLFVLPARGSVTFSALPSVSSYGVFAALDGIGAAGTTGVAVLRGALVDDGMGIGLATLAENGTVRRLATGTEQNPSFAGGTDNVRLDLTGDVTLPAAAVNTLELHNDSGSPVTVTLSGTLTPQNGLLFSGNSPITLTGGAIDANADAANGEAILLTVNTAGVTIVTPVTGKNITVGGNGDIALNGNLTADSNGNGYITVNTTGLVSWGQKSTGCGALRLYAGTTRLQSGAKLYENNSQSSGGRAYLAVNAHAILDLNGISAKVNGVTGAGAISSPEDAPATLTCAWYPAGINYTGYGPTFSGTLYGAVSMTFDSDGYYATKYTQNLSCDSVSTGTVTVSRNMTLSLAANAALGDGRLVMNGGNLNVNEPRIMSGSNPQSWKSFTFKGSANLDMGNGPVTLAAASVTLTVTSNTLIVGGPVGEAAAGSSFTKAGDGTLVLNGTNTYTGTTTVSKGTLTLGGNQADVRRTMTVADTGTLRLSPLGRIGEKTKLFIDEGGQVKLDNIDPVIVRSLTVAGVTQDPYGTYGAVGSGARTELACFSGLGMLSFAPSGTIILVR